MMLLHPFRRVKALINQKSSFCVSWKNRVGNNIRLRKYVQIMHLSKIRQDRNLLNFSISQLNVHEQTKLSLVLMGVLMVYGFTLWLAKGALLIYCHIPQDSFQPACRIYQSCAIAGLVLISPEKVRGKKVT